MPRRKGVPLEGEALTALANQVEELRLLRALELCVRRGSTWRVIEEELKKVDAFRRTANERRMRPRVEEDDPC